MPIETIVEYVATSAARIDRANGLLRGVKVLGLTSKNGREYPLSTIRRAVSLYEGCGVNVDHDEHAKTRTYESRIGVLREARVSDDGLRANLHVNPKHPVAEQLFWDGENAPGNVGLSHSIQARTSRRNGKLIVEEIMKVTSVDLVSDPASTRGLFEHVECETGENIESAADFLRAVSLPPSAFNRAQTAESTSFKAKPTVIQNAADFCRSILKED